MMKFEFESLVKCEVTYDDYKNIFEPMYNELPDISKQDFAKLVKPMAKKLAEQHDAEKAINKKYVFVGAENEYESKADDDGYYKGYWYKRDSYAVDNATGLTLWGLSDVPTDDFWLFNDDLSKSKHVDIYPRRGQKILYFYDGKHACEI